MIGEHQRRFAASGLSYFAPPLQATLVKLAEARDYARDVQCDPRQYAVEIDALMSLGATARDLQWLIRNGCVEHLKEITKAADAERRFRPAGTPRFGKRSCFVATDAGLQFTTREFIRPTMRRSSLGSVDACNQGVVPMIVHDEESRILLNPRAISENDNLREAFSRLSHAGACARDAGCDAWQYAVEIESLLGNGLDMSDLRWLVNKGLISHAKEITRSRDSVRRFQPCGNLSFNKRTCFVLTDSGDSLAAAACSPPPGFPPGGPPSGLPWPPRSGRSAAVPVAPAWDSHRRVLHVAGCIVKQFRVPSPGQEAILSAFQEEGWPDAIDDPLSPAPDQDSKQRLRHTIRALNANQKEPLIQFHGDGTGRRILWELTDLHPRQGAGLKISSLRAA